MTVRIMLSDNRIPELRTKVPRQVEKILRETATKIVDQAKMGMREPKSGRYYVVSRTGKLHRASAPGESPAIDTGNLVNSFEIKKINDALFKINVNADYASHLEFGTTKMAPRPFLIPAVEKLKDYFVKELSKLFEAK